MNLNKAIIIGRLTADPQIKTTPGGQSVSTFSVATNRVWKDKNDQKQEDTEFHNVVVWGRQAEVAGRYLVKGSEVMIEGRIKTRSWQDKDNNTRRTTEIICESLQLGSRPMNAPNRNFEPEKNREPEQMNNNFKSENSNPVTKKEELPTIDMDDEAGGPDSDKKEDDLPF